MAFSQNYGYVPEKAIQLESIDDALRNRLINYLNSEFPCPIIVLHHDLKNIRGYVLDKFGKNLSDINLLDVGTEFDKCFTHEEWHRAYDAIEHCIDWVEKQYSDDDSNKSKIEKMSFDINEILEEEKSGYRLLNKAIVPITSELELESLKNSTNTDHENVNAHMQKAVTLYSDRNDPDYENSIKEAISAVEALCCTICSKKATLGQAIKKLKDGEVRIHTALEEAFEKIYGYTSDESGIRHGGMDFNNAPAEDAKYMLVSCSAFINYLIEKMCKTGQ